MSFFKRLFKVGQSQAHALVDKIEDPVKMTEQGIRDLKDNLTAAMKSLAEVKGVGIRTRKEADSKRNLAQDYERKAMLLLQKAQNGELDQAEAEKLALKALGKKEENEKEAEKLYNEASLHEKRADDLQLKINKLKSTISSYENDLIILKARARTAASAKKINAQFAEIDSSSTISMLEKMKSKVEEDEALAEAYGDMAATATSVDSEIDAALGDTGSSASLDGLAALKKKMGIMQN